MSPAEVLYYDLLGVVLVCTADLFHLWDPFAAALTRAYERLRNRRDDDDQPAAPDELALFGVYRLDRLPTAGTC